MPMPPTCTAKRSSSSLSFGSQTGRARGLADLLAANLACPALGAVCIPCSILSGDLSAPIPRHLTMVTPQVWPPLEYRAIGCFPDAEPGFSRLTVNEAAARGLLQKPPLVKRDRSRTRRGNRGTRRCAQRLPLCAAGAIPGDHALEIALRTFCVRIGRSHTAEGHLAHGNPRKIVGPGVGKGEIALTGGPCRVGPLTCGPLGCGPAEPFARRGRCRRGAL